MGIRISQLQNSSRSIEAMRHRTITRWRNMRGEIVQASRER